MASHIIFQIYTTNMKTVQKLWALNTALSIYVKIQNYYYSYANIIHWFKDEHLFKCDALGNIRKLDVNQYIFPYTFNQTSAMTCELFSQSSFSRAFLSTERI